jgi:Lytic transglycolase
MNARLARRQAALAGVALVGALGAIALSQINDDSDAAPPPTATVAWESATVGVFEPPDDPTSCGVTVTQETVGIAHPVLPCGATILVEHQGRSARADVVERGPVDAGRAFDLSPALARELGVSATTVVRWRFVE